MINVVKTEENVTPKSPDSYFQGRSDNSKVKKIANRINEIVSKADPSMRKKVLNEATVKYNNKTMTLQQFLD